MKYCINYRRDIKCKNEVDELRINYNRNDSTLFDFISVHKDQRINIVINDVKEFTEHYEWRKFAAFETKEENPHNYAIVLPSCSDSECIALYEVLLEKTNVPMYFNTRVNNWDTLIGLAEMEISDMYIVEDLGFELPRVSEYLKSKGIRIRAFANVCQSSWRQTPAFKTFFIRPEDVDIYDEYIDVLEFFYERPDQQNVLYRVYSKEKKWAGNLSEIIFGFNEEVDSRCLLPEFATKRLNCGKKCYRGHHCEFCERALRLSKTMRDSNLVFHDNTSFEDEN